MGLVFVDETNAHSFVKLNPDNMIREFDVCVTVHHWYNNINTQLCNDNNFINNFIQINMFRAIISPILRSTRLCLQLVV